jgi:hypothetical protein
MLSTCCERSAKQHLTQKVQHGSTLKTHMEANHGSVFHLRNTVNLARYLVFNQISKAMFDASPGVKQYPVSYSYFGSVHIPQHTS